MILSGFIVALTFATTIGNLQVKEAPLADPYPIQQEMEYDVIQVKLTYYDACYSCCGKTDGITASGVKAQVNHTIAAPKEYAFGQQIEIDGVMYTVEDRGGNINGNRFDIYVGSHQEAVNLGVRYAEAKVYR